MNPYHYVGNSPTTFIDPSGLFSHQHCCDDNQLRLLEEAETAAKTRLALWERLLNPGPSEVDIYNHLKRLYPRDDVTVNATRRIGIFTRDVRINTGLINRSLCENSLGAKCERSCAKGVIAYVVKRTGLKWLLFGTDDHIHFCPPHFKRTLSQRTGDIVHELSHYFADTKDDYAWIQPASNIVASASIAQLYSQMGESGTTDDTVKAIYWTWINAARSAR
jgi:hypothetical protein